MTDPRFEAGQPVPTAESGSVVPVGIEPLPGNPVLAEIASRVIDAYPRMTSVQDESPKGTQPQEGEQQ
jgi:hypothetical protein